MPLHKYRSVEDMPSPTWATALDPANLRRPAQIPVG
jgi:hypothetical protein